MHFLIGQRAVTFQVEYLVLPPATRGFTCSAGAPKRSGAECVRGRLGELLLAARVPEGPCRPRGALPCRRAASWGAIGLQAQRAGELPTPRGPPNGD